MQLLPLKYKTISPLCFCKRTAQCYLKHRTPCISFSKKTSKTCSINYFRKLRSLSVLHDERNLVLELENTNLLTIQWENMWQFLHLATIAEGPGNPGGKQAGWSQEWQLPNYPSSFAEEKEEVFLEGLWLATAWTPPRPLKLKGLKNWKKKKKKSYFILYVIHKQCHLKGWTSHLKSTRGVQPPQWAYSLVSNKRDTSLKCVLFCFKPSPTPSYYQTMFTGLPQLTHLVWIFRHGQLPKIAFQSWSYSRKKCPKK